MVDSVVRECAADYAAHWLEVNNINLLGAVIVESDLFVLGGIEDSLKTYKYCVIDIAKLSEHEVVPIEGILTFVKCGEFKHTSYAFDDVYAEIVEKKCRQVTSGDDSLDLREDVLRRIATCSNRELLVIDKVLKYRGHVKV